MINLLQLIFFFTIIVSVASGSAVASNLPTCSNRVIQAVTAKSGCTVGDANCWMSKGGFCTDYITKRTQLASNDSPPRLVPISQAQVKKGDVAHFLKPMHYSYVESVVRDAGGKPVAVNLSEYNYGTCWVDEDSMVTDRYMRVNRRSVPVGRVDGGFLRPR
ncbi:hypothetical protein [Geotalea sp. SG265]|uniref:hypothetical protein n=1 Tax=Geotalea sp. SG265 TaxID=2922867 RepID=UPI001FAEAC76|nr:hypothetical protein [Geotalea sp. SG265]